MSRSREGLSHAGVSVVARTVGSRDCLRAVGSECGLIGSACGLAGSCVCVECELKPALVCKPACDCLQAATANALLPMSEKGIRDLVMELCCALYNFRVRLSPWQPMVSSG